MVHYNLVTVGQWDSGTVGQWDNGTIKQLDNLTIPIIYSIINIINKHMQYQKLTIPMTETDCEDIMHGEEFHWTFETDKGEPIDIHLRLETQEDIDS